MSPKLRCLVVGIPDAVFPDVIREHEVALTTLVALREGLPLPPGVELVVAPLFCEEFDALEMIELLGTSGFRGTLRIAALKLPNRQIVLRELRSHAVRQGITLELVEPS